MADRLRAEGVQISSLVRDAIRTEYARRIEHSIGRRGPDVVRTILADLPDPPNLPPRDFSIQDRKAVKEHIRGRLTRGRR